MAALTGTLTTDSYRPAPAKFSRSSPLALERTARRHRGRKNWPHHFRWLREPGSPPANCEVPGAVSPGQRAPLSAPAAAKRRIFPASQHSHSGRVPSRQTGPPTRAELGIVRKRWRAPAGLRPAALEPQVEGVAWSSVRIPGRCAKTASGIITGSGFRNSLFRRLSFFLHRDPLRADPETHELADEVRKILQLHPLGAGGQGNAAGGPARRGGKDAATDVPGNPLDAIGDFRVAVRRFQQ